MLVARDLCKRFGEVVALDGCSLTAARGRVLGLLGACGSGRSTALQALVGLVRTDSGSIEWDGRPVCRRERLRFGYMPQQEGLFEEMAAVEQLDYLARLHGGGKADVGRRLLHELGLGRRATFAPADLPHGDRRRVQLAAALICDPQLLVLDEPFAGLASADAQIVADVLRRQTRCGRAIILSGGLLDPVRWLCDDVVVMQEGSSVLAGDAVG